MKFTFYHLCLSLLFIILFRNETTGQITKGDFILDFSGNAYNLFKGTEVTSVYANVTYMRLFTNKWMFGGSFSYIYNHNSIRNSEGTFSYPFNAYSISPSFRYYFFNGRLAPFASLENRFTYQKFTEEGPFDDFNGYQAITGVGLDYFLGRNVAVEASVTSNIANFGDYEGTKPGIFASAGLKLFINSSLESPVDSLAAKVLKKGVFSTSSSIGTSHQFSSPSTGYFNFSPDIRYFVTDRFNLYGSLGFTQYRFRTNDQYIARIGLGAEYYFKLHLKYYIRAGVKGDLSLDTGKLKDLFDSPYTRIDLPLSSDLNYFTKNKRLFTGVAFNYTGLFIHKRKLYSSKFKTIYAGMDYFLSQNIYVNGSINFNLSKGNLFKPSISSAFRIGFLLDAGQFK